MMSINERQEVKFFKGKVVIVYLVNASDAFSGGVAISEPQVRDLNGRFFLIGTAPANTEDWTSGLRTGIAIDQIAHFLEFDDENDFLLRTSSGKSVQ